MPLSSSKIRQIALVVGVVLVGMNLRPTITAISPLAERIYADGLSREVIGGMTAIPLVLFGAVGLWASWVGRRIGLARALGLGLVLLALGCVLRSAGGDLAGLWRVVGTMLIGGGIALGNVLLPGLVKSRFPNHVGLMTSLYATAMNLGAAAGIALAVPLANGLAGGWRSALAAWGAVAVVTLVVWSPQMGPPPMVRRPMHPLAGVGELVRQWRAWQVAAYMGLQSTVFYSTVAWLPTVLQSRGMSESAAAGWSTGMQVVGCVASLIVPMLAGRSASQSGWTVACAGFTSLGLLGILLLPVSAIGVAVMMTGIGLNAGFGLVLLLLALRSKTPETAASLSSMSQCVGYLFAAPWPWLMGLVSTTRGGWPLAFGIIFAISMMGAVAGYLAGRPGELALASDG